MKTTGIHSHTEYGRTFTAPYTVTDGVMTWDSNGNVPPEDIVDSQAKLDSNIDVDKSDKARDEQMAKFFAEYREARSQRTPEQVAQERAEARAEIGPGVELVDIITGERWTT